MLQHGELSFDTVARTASVSNRPLSLSVHEAGVLEVLLRLFEALNRLGTTVLVATHDLHLLQKVPDSLIMRLDRGRLTDPTGALRFPPRRPARAPQGVA